MTAAPRRRVLLVDDDAAFRKVYAGLLRDAGYEVREAADREGARKALEGEPPEVVLLDLMLPPDGTVEAGLQQLEQVLARAPGAKVVVVSGAGDTRHMLSAVKVGAYDFLTKPVDPDVLLVVVERAAARLGLEAQVRSLQATLAQARPDRAMVGESPVFLAAVAMAEKIALSDLPVLVTGENGTGKELLARSVHQSSRRKDGAFVAVNCGALAETLLETTLFGHVKGSFTGATRDHKGLFVEADGGTLFLDEVADMPPSLQVKVLRAIEYGEILPVGADRPSRVDVRVISATHKDLLQAQREGAFREDLYWRLKGVEIRLPSLRERTADIPLLAKHFLNQSAQLTTDGRPRLLSDAALEALAQHPWPGNLRELRHEMQRAAVLAGDRREIQPEDLSFTGAERPRPAADGPPGSTLQEKIESLERREIEAALQKHNNNRTHAAAALGLSRQGLLKKLERYGLS
ncbi:MAG TPA: sigma-54 dependent transcriptional regulator [Myxococcaceae bacterium]|nr:sigma-54 dependent transcriptional regulator [Myxococcaceae bacterium]